MATEHADAFLPFVLKTEPNARDDSDGEVNLDDADGLLSMSLPSLSVNNSVLHDGADGEFLRLTAMVRAVYLSYLHKCLLRNYVTCHEQKDEDVPSIEVKKCADELELNAVRLALEASLYRQNMLRMIADIKSHTVNKKVYGQLLIFLETPKDKIDVAVQTSDTSTISQGMDNIQSVCITSNCEEVSQAVSPFVSSNDFCENLTGDLDNEMDVEMSHRERDTLKEIFADSSQRLKDVNEPQMMDEDGNSQDSLLQHMEDMFCESDDSSDLTTLIEKYSGVSKANIDKEINEICSKADTTANLKLCNASQSNSILSMSSVGTNNNMSSAARVSTSEGKMSYSRYKEIRSGRNDAQIDADESSIVDTKNLKQKGKMNAVWFVERVHQVSKLKVKLTELTLMDYRRYGKMKEKFHELFGESDEEDMKPDSPICIEEYLPACKERIAPWIVKYLMPFYKKRRIKDRQLFKVVAKYIADMLIIEDTFPEQECVSKYIDDYFKNKRFIKTKQDIYI